jgi:predicted ATP-grasp superfamily ATP-dependent carboligase
LSPPAIQAVDALPPAVILGGFYPTFSVARSLGRRGIDVHVLGESANTLPAHSRFVKSFLATPDCAEARWRDWFSSGPHGAVVIPCGDTGLEFAARNRGWLEQFGYRVSEGNDAVTLAMLDKAKTYELAAAAGIDVPRTASVRTREELELVLGDFEYPCALKPRDSFRFNQLFARKAFVVGSAAELQAAFEQILPTGLEMIVTEVVSGEASEYFEFCSYYSYLDENGDPLLHFTKRKLREYPLGWGTGTYHVTKWDPEVAEVGLRFFQGVGLRGIGNVEFKRDRRDGRLKLIECNPRPTASDKLLRIAGLDLAWIAYERALGRGVAVNRRFRDGVRQWNPPQDFKALLEGRRAGTLRPLPWFASLLHVQHLPTFDLRDPMPTVALINQQLYGLVKRSARRR